MSHLTLPHTRAELRTLERVKVDPEWKLARCIVGGGSREISSEKPAAKFPSNLNRKKTADRKCFSPSSGFFLSRFMDLLRELQLGP